MPDEMVTCPKCEGAGNECKLCLGAGEVTEFDAVSPRATISARESREKYKNHAKKTAAEVLASSIQKKDTNQFPRAPVEIQKSLVAFAEEWPEVIPLGSKSFLYKTAKKMIVEVGAKEAPKFVHWASSIIKNEKPELIDGVKSFDSFSFLIAKWRREHGDRCPACGEDWRDCLDEWGSQKRQEKYGGGGEW